MNYREVVTQAVGLLTDGSLAPLDIWVVRNYIIATRQMVLSPEQIMDALPTGIQVQESAQYNTVLLFADGQVDDMFSPLVENIIDDLETAAYGSGEIDYI